MRSRSKNAVGPQRAVALKHHLHPLLSSLGSKTYMPQPCSQHFWSSLMRFRPVTKNPVGDTQFVKEQYWQKVEHL